ncbi:hypothetical protein CF327_g5585 [Tilletia walkeri]|uniref:Uncharacterized protein n=1 Tax=Tilletia walkeri TaxID=117179 RepID=A0A8X7NC98_9BASI|nr:hypothetical protein CF327_g5585 [Tilletia walkeri]KAE8269380.1 hypothetical protein A4X09_0g2947 [Tilletia walkeri]
MSSQGNTPNRFAVTHVILRDSAEASIAEDFRFIQASHRAWSQGHSMELDSKCVVEVVTFVRASRQDVRPILRTLDNRNQHQHQDLQATPGSTAGSGRFLLPGQDGGGASPNGEREPERIARATASRGHFVIPTEGEVEVSNWNGITPTAAANTSTSLLKEETRPVLSGTKLSGSSSTISTKRASNEPGMSHADAGPSNPKQRRLGTAMRR